MRYLLTYPPELTEAQIAKSLATQVRTMRWPDYEALEPLYGLDTLPDEPRTAGLWLARRIRRHLGQVRRFKEAQAGLRSPEHCSPPAEALTYDPYVMVLAAYVSDARLALFLSDVRRVAQAGDETDASSSTEKLMRDFYRLERSGQANPSG